MVMQMAAAGICWGGAAWPGLVWAAYGCYWGAGMQASPSGHTIGELVLQIEIYLHVLHPGCGYGGIRCVQASC
jgi:hypothetical protein